MKIEICLESIESVIAAEQGGADRVEFCADLFEGGTTPSLGAFKAARAYSSIAMNVMVRPRGGDFATGPGVRGDEGGCALPSVRQGPTESFGILTPTGRST